MNKRFIIIDGNSLLFRAYYATAYAGVDKIMRTKSGIPTNAIFAFANMMVRILNDLNEDDHLFVAFDTGEKTFRHEEYEDYKAGRKAVPEELITQFPIAREFLDALSIPHAELVGYEADDLAGTLAHKAEKEGFKVELFTSDQDYLQLVSDNINVKLIRRGLSDVLTLDPETLYETFGYHPHQATDYKGLLGDPSDNLKGIPGIGKITAQRLLKEYGSLEAIIEASPNINGKLGENIREYADLARTSKRLATLITDIPHNLALDTYHYAGYDASLVQAFSAKYEMRQFINNLNYSTKKNTEVKVEVIKNYNEIKEKKIKDFSFYLTSSDGPYYRATPLLLYLGIGKNVYVIDFDNFKKDQSLLRLFADETITKYSYDIKRAIVILNNFNININGPLNDALILTYVYDTNISANIQSFLLSYGVSASNEEELLLPILVFNLQDVYKKGLDKLANEGLLDVYQTIEKPLTNVLAKMEIEGFPVKEDKLLEIGDEYKAILEDLTAKIYAQAGHEFNINSPQQVATVLFDELGLKMIKKRSTAIDVLTRLENKHPIIPLLIEYRKYQKIVTTYIDGFVTHIYEDGKVHSSFNQATTSTGRLSSNDPNLQNISIRNEEGRELRKAFHAGDKLVLAIDYSQIELRLLACIANVPSLIKVFNEGHDIHNETAARLFPLEDLDFARRKAKAVNFGIVYGISDFGLSEQLDITIGEGRSIIQSFFNAYPEIWTYRQNIINELQNEGYVTTLTGRKRYIPQINDPNYQTREFAKRAAMNAPIQGSAADLIKLAMIKVDAFLSENNYKTKLISQVHDELIFALEESEKHIVDDIVSIMENVFDLPLKLKAEVSIGKDWFTAS
ncbi:MAG: DNA polymerase I [Bacilli bacterium]